MTRFEWDAEAGDAYLRLAANIEDGAVIKNIALEAIDGTVEYDIILDFDDQNRLLGIEILNARAALGAESLAALIEDSV